MNETDSKPGLSQLLDAALDLPPARRNDWIDGLHAQHDALKPRLRALLARAAFVESRDFLGSLPDFGDTEIPGLGGSFSGEAAGDRVGPYQLQRQLGAGGMGTVWLATRADGMFERNIALKLPHRGMFGADLAERMARERGILAGLDHPHIARLYDAGLTTEGQPYLALEYVEGVAIDEYCRRNNCALRERLNLFLQVADAVASAHARLVVHRDLKPANILVGNDGQARLLDFGIAKLLDTPSAAEVPLTQLSVHAMTPDYASPEQILGQPVTIASDVYSLGVVLYELLAGVRPYRLRRDTRGALEDAILQSMPRRPSEACSQGRALRGDLDTIVLKALHKQPDERYATVNAFADDLRRHQQGRPVLARPDSAWYRSSRFVRRNRLGVAAAGSVVLALAAAAVVASLGLVQARAAERRARAEAETTRHVSRFMVDLFNVSDPGEARGNSITAREILDKASTRVTTGLTLAPQVRAELLSTMADVYAKLGLYGSALELSQPALALRRTQSPGSVDLADGFDQVGEILMLLRRSKEAIPLHQQALELRRVLEPVDHAAIAKTLQHLAVSHYVDGDFKGTMPLLIESRDELRKAADPSSQQLGELLKYTASIQQEQGDLATAIETFREALALLRGALGDDHPKVAGALGDLAIALKETRRYEEAEKAYLDSLAIQRKVLGPRHPDVGNALNNLSVMYAEQGKFEPALAAAQEGSEILRATLGDAHDTTNITRLNLARAHAQLGHLGVAEQELRDIIATRRRTGTTDNISFAVTVDALADVLNRESKYAEALPHAREACASTEKAIGRDHWRWATVNRTLGVTLMGLKRYAEAEPVLLDSYELMRSKRGDGHRTTLLNAQRLVELYKSRGQTTRAAEWQLKIDRAHQ
ncbi:MAG: serine/threonine-protein kinase [Pseudomonadota bacterium]